MRTMTRLALGLALTAALATSLVVTPLPAAAQQSGRAAVVSGMLDAWSRGDVDGALSAFADDAVFIAARVTGPCATTTPCTDLAGVRQQLEFAVGLNICQTLRTVAVTGSVVLGQFETRTDTDRARGVERLLRSFMAQIPTDKITFFAVLNDLTDPQTAGTLGPRAPLPNPATPCAGVSSVTTPVRATQLLPFLSGVGLPRTGSTDGESALARDVPLP